MTQQPPSIDELICTCISRQIQDGEIVAQGIATPLVAAGYLLAKWTHAPNILFASAIGQTLCRDPAPLAISNVEQLWIKQGLQSFSFVSVTCDLLPRFAPKEFFRPGQVDAHGNFNNVFIGGSYEHPQLRLPGVGGIPDVTVMSNKVYLYVPRHGRHTFVPKLNLLSGMGHNSQRLAGQGPHYLISDLGQFDFTAEGRMRILSLHPGVSLRQVQMKTGFELVAPSEIPETEPPTTEEVHLLRELIDPLGVRLLETLRGAHRHQKLVEILEQEKGRG